MGFILGLVATLVIPCVIQVFTAPPDFIITIDKPADSATITSVIEITVNISDNYDIYHWLHPYDQPIALIAYQLGASTLPTGVEDQFIKQLFKMNGSREVSNKLIIAPNEKAEKGHSIIKISGIGGDGRERSCLFDLEVRNK